MNPAALLLMLITLALAPACRGDVKVSLQALMSPGALEVRTLTDEWMDHQRQRELPVRLYVPQGRTPRQGWPVVIVSHGLGGSRDGIAYLGRHLAGHGFLALHLQHPGSDASLLQRQPGQRMTDRMTDLKAAASGENLVLRMGDVSFAIDELTRLNRDDNRFRGQLDLSRIAVAGHSFGAHTTLGIAGQAYRVNGRLTDRADERVKAAIALSPAPPMNRRGLDEAFGQIRIPVMHFTGTEDASPLDPTLKPIDRRLPFDHIRHSEQYLAIFDAAEHMVFGGRSPIGRASSVDDKTLHALIGAGAVAFLNLTLYDHTEYRTLLRDDWAAAVDKVGTFEAKDANASK